MENQKKTELLKIDEEINALQLKRNALTARTRDDFPIEIGKEYFFLENLSRGFESIKIAENVRFEDSGLSYDGRYFMRYEILFTTKQAAYDWMKSFLDNALLAAEANVESRKSSIELLKKLCPTSPKEK